MRDFCTREAHKRMHAFLSQYVVTQDDEEIPMDCLFYKDAINLLLTGGVFQSKEELKKECLEEQLFIIPDFLFE